MQIAIRAAAPDANHAIKLAKEALRDIEAA